MEDGETNTNAATPNRRRSSAKEDSDNLFNIIKFAQDHDKFKFCVSETKKKEEEQRAADLKHFSSGSSNNPMTSFTAALNQVQELN